MPNQVKLGFVYALLAGVLIAMCACMGCRTEHSLALSGYAQYRGTVCEVCGRTDRIQACHIYPQTDYPELRNTKSNIISLCYPCHNVLSHFRNTSRFWNPNLREIVDVMKKSKRTYRKYEVKQ